MAVCQISVNREAKVWSSSIYTKNATPVELYRWMTTRFDLTDERLLSVSVQREEQRKIRTLKRTQSMPLDLNKTACENPFWYTVRVVHRYNEDDTVFTAEHVFRKILIRTVIDDSLSTLKALEKSEVTLCGAIPERRAVFDKTDYLTKSERVELRNVVTAEGRAFRKENHCYDDFQAYIKKNGCNELSVKMMRKFALDHLIFGGHWTIYAEQSPMTSASVRCPVDGVQVVETWKQLLKGFLFGPLAASRATAVSFKRTPDGRSICISNPRCLAIQKDLTEEDPWDNEVLSVDRAIRSCGYKGRMKYKPDVFSACQITHSNQHVLRPTIYLSEVNSLSGESRIRTDYTKDYTPEVRMGEYSAYRLQSQDDVVASRTPAASNRAQQSSASSVADMWESLSMEARAQPAASPPGLSYTSMGTSRRPTTSVFGPKPG